MWVLPNPINTVIWPLPYAIAKFQDLMVSLEYCEVSYTQTNLWEPFLS